VIDTSHPQVVDRDDQRRPAREFTAIHATPLVQLIRRAEMGASLAPRHGGAKDRQSTPRADQSVRLERPSVAELRAEVGLGNLCAYFAACAGGGI
jgi:hypothetical protein